MDEFLCIPKYKQVSFVDFELGQGNKFENRYNLAKRIREKFGDEIQIQIHFKVKVSHSS